MSRFQQPLPQVSDLKRYLLKRGWRQVEHPNQRIAVLQEGNNSYITIPSSDAFANSETMIAEAIGIIAEHEHQSSTDLLNRLSRWGKDTMLARLFKINGEETSIPLSVAAEAIRSAFPRGQIIHAARNR